MAINGSQAAAQINAWTDGSGHRVSFVTVAPTVDLEVLDWAGGGPVIFLLAGLGNTAHVFDHFAHQFTARFRVVGITRRGFGASSRPATGYDSDTLARDVLAIADALKVDRVILIGHSIAGDEITKFAATYPTRVSAIVYLDAAYDRTQAPTSTPVPEQPVADDDTASIERLEARFARVFGWRLPEGEVRAQVVVGSDGKVLRSTASPEVSAQILKGVSRPSYAKVRSPALAVYASVQVRSTFPNFQRFDSENKSRAEGQIAGLTVWQDDSIAQFRREAPNGRVVILESGNHYLFLTNESEVVGLTMGFLSDALGR
jgi:pimeloyl-ACP methyl ester carboxylesterase